MVAFWPIEYVKDLIHPGMKLKALIVYPNKNVVIKKINVREMRFSVSDRMYVIDEKAIYYHKKKPMLIYHFNNASPLMFTDITIDPSMKPEDINAVIESKMVKDLLTASLSNDWVLYAAIAAAGLSLFNTLILTGVIKVG